MLLFNHFKNWNLNNKNPEIYAFHIFDINAVFLSGCHINAIQVDITAKTIPLWLQHLNARVVCPNFGPCPITYTSFMKYKFLQVNNTFANIVNRLSVLKLFQLSNGDLNFSYHAYSIYKVRRPNMTKLRQGVRS